MIPLHGVEGDSALPGLDDPYQAVSRVTGHPETCLCIIMGDAGFKDGGKAYRFFQYVHLNSNTDFGFTRDRHGQTLQVMTLRFTDIEPVVVIIRGVNLLRACHNIHKHRIAWIRLLETGRAFPSGELDRGKKAEIITSIEILEGRDALAGAAQTNVARHDANKS